ncbi:MAG TPA: SDR family NAD(P)-dependent oxidoreductase [Anaeromyxobacter sp.]|nr:SDR family NAD(P)-dependent oxidoreductase [Anaeromyxobacter sp.]
MSAADAFEGRVVVVTGGSSGIGEGIVRAFAARGARVAIVSTGADRGAALARELGSGVVHLAAELASPEAIRALPARVEEALGLADVVVNNAGIYRQGDVRTTSEDEWRAVLAVNLDAAFLVAKAFVPHLVGRGGGAIVNVASEAGLRAIRNQVAYNVSKAGLVALTRSLAVDLAPLGIRANAVCPGTTLTPLVERVIQSSPDPAATRRALEAVRPLDRLGAVDEIAEAVVFLASPAVGYATGAVLAVDGGFSA